MSSPVPPAPDAGAPVDPADPAEEPTLEVGPAGEGGPTPARRGGPRRPVVLAVLAVLVLAAAGTGYAVYRSYKDRKIVELSVRRAELLVRSDTWLGYRTAAHLLGLRAAALDLRGAGALRGYALALAALDHHEGTLAGAADAQLQAPLAADEVPTYANLGTGALELRQGRAGTAQAYATKAGDAALAQVLQARVALFAARADLAREALEAALRADPDLPAASALLGDVLRRAGETAEAHRAYAAALAASSAALSEEAKLGGAPFRPGARAPHARATFGLAKLALGRESPPEEAVAALTEMVNDRDGTPGVERARAAMYLAALQGRAGDHAAAAETLSKAGLDPELRAWLERAAGQLEVARGRYAVPEGTPVALVSPSDDDLYVPPPPPPPKVEAPTQPKIYGFKVEPAHKAPPRKATNRAKKVRKSGR